MASAPLKTFLARTQIFSSQLQALPRCATTSSAAHPRRFHGLRDLLLPSHPDRDSGLTPRPTEFAIASVKSTQRGDSAIYNLLASPEWCKFLPRLFIQTGISGRCCHRVTTAISGARPVVTGGAMRSRALAGAAQTAARPDYVAQAPRSYSEADVRQWTPRPELSRPGARLGADGTPTVKNVRNTRGSRLLCAARSRAPSGSVYTCRDAMSEVLAERVSAPGMTLLGMVHCDSS
jgi:hypothetical protein